MTVEAEDQPRLEGRVQLFRGLTPHTDPGAWDRRRGITPPQPLGQVDDWAAIFMSGTTIEHVRGKKRLHARSFSLNRNIATWWATGGGKHDGFVAEWVTEIINSARYGGIDPYHHRTIKGQVLLDPRFLPDFDLKVLLRAQMVRNYSRVDQEVLLLDGRVIPTLITKVSASQCPRDFVPYDFWGQKF